MCVTDLHIVRKRENRVSTIRRVRDQKSARVTTDNRTDVSVRRPRPVDLFACGNLGVVVVGRVNPATCSVSRGLRRRICLSISVTSPCRLNIEAVKALALKIGRLITSVFTPKLESLLN